MQDEKERCRKNEKRKEEEIEHKYRRKNDEIKRKR